MNDKAMKWIPIGLGVLFITGMVLSALWRFLPSSVGIEVAKSESQTWAIFLYARLCLLQPIVIGILQIGIAVWLWYRTRSYDKVRWLWGLLGLVFGLMAVATFYVVEIYRRTDDLMEIDKKAAQPGQFGNK